MQNLAHQLGEPLGITRRRGNENNWTVTR